ncbi:MAG: hypothetical protein QNJ51_29030 [Calothrix sp. MO_167.B12]|nr:hypothetical protein [Calothrix sp. MO_167.B12]
MKNKSKNIFDIDINSLLSILPKSPLGLLISIAIGLGIGVGYGSSHYKATNSQSSAIAQPNQLTRAEYERLQIGMQLVEVEAILGRGTETQRYITHRVFVWKNSDDSKIITTFEDGKLIRKQQEGFK